MSHILPDVVSCYCYNLRIIRHLQQPRQDPVEERMTEKEGSKLRALSTLKHKVNTPYSQMLLVKAVSEKASENK